MHALDDGTVIVRALIDGDPVMLAGRLDHVVGLLEPEPIPDRLAAGALQELVVAAVARVEYPMGATNWRVRRAHGRLVSAVGEWGRLGLRPSFFSLAANDIAVVPSVEVAP